MLKLFFRLQKSNMITFTIQHVSRSPIIIKINYSKSYRVYVSYKVKSYNFFCLRCKMYPKTSYKYFSRRDLSVTSPTEQNVTSAHALSHARVWPSAVSSKASTWDAASSSRCLSLSCSPLLREQVQYFLLPHFMFFPIYSFC